MASCLVEAEVIKAEDDLEEDPQVNQIASAMVAVATEKMVKRRRRSSNHIVQGSSTMQPVIQ